MCHSIRRTKELAAAKIPHVVNASESIEAMLDFAIGVEQR